MLYKESLRKRNNRRNNRLTNIFTKRLKTKKHGIIIKKKITIIASEHNYHMDFEAA